MNKVSLIIIFVFLVGVGFYYFFSHKTITPNSSTLKKSSVTIRQEKIGTMKILSKAFANKQSIPKQYTCDGKGINPEVQFEAVPAEAKSLVLLMDDPDVPKNLKPDGVFDHWVVYNIDPTVKEISENSKPPGIEGLNGTGKLGFTPPCPPDREHRYFFKLYALSTMLDLNNPERVTKDMVLQKMQRHIIEEAELVGVYNRLQNQK